MKTNMTIQEKDGFFGEHHTMKYYMKRLEKIGEPEYIMQLAKDLISMKPIDSDSEDQDGSKIRTKWDGYTLYHFERWNDGFARLSIEPDIGYIEFGFGHTE